MSGDAKNSVNWGMLCHAAGLAMYLGIPFGNIIAPMVIWLAKKDSDARVREEGPEAVNFNISFTIYGMIVGFLCYLLIGFVLFPVLLVVHVVLVVQATLKANKGQKVRYPLTLRFIN